MPDGSIEPQRRSQDEMFLVLVTDAVAKMYPVLELRADKPLALDVLQTKMAQMGLLDDVTCGLD